MRKEAKSATFGPPFGSLVKGGQANATEINHRLSSGSRGEGEG